MSNITTATRIISVHLPYHYLQSEADHSIHHGLATLLFPGDLSPSHAPHPPQKAAYSLCHIPRLNLETAQTRFYLCGHAWHLPSTSTNLISPGRIHDRLQCAKSERGKRRDWRYGWKKCDDFRDWNKEG